MKKFCKLIFVSVFSIIVVFSFSSYISAQQGQPIIIKVATVQPEEQSEGKFAIKFKELVEEKTNGAAKVEIYFRSQLGSQKDYLEGLRLGTLEVTWVTPGFFSSYESILNILELPYLFTTREHTFWMVNGPLENFIREKVEKHGFKLLAFFEVGYRQITNNVRPIYSPEDLKGLKIRVPQAKISVDSLTAMGANATPLSGSELYLALQQGIFDGQENPCGQIYYNKWYEVQKYLSKTNHLYMIHMVLYSDKLWKQLPEEIQLKIEEAAQEAAVYEVKIAAEEDAYAERALKELGMIINDANIDLFKESVKPLYKQYIEEFGPEAERIINLIQMTQF